MEGLVRETKRALEGSCKKACLPRVMPEGLARTRGDAFSDFNIPLLPRNAILKSVPMLMMSAATRGIQCCKKLLLTIGTNQYVMNHPPCDMS